jgi:hypothetical protein
MNNHSSNGINNCGVVIVIYVRFCYFFYELCRVGGAPHIPLYKNDQVFTTYYVQRMIKLGEKWKTLYKIVNP